MSFILDGEVDHSLSICFVSFAVQVGKREDVGRVHGIAIKRRRTESVYALVLEKIIAAKILWYVIL